MKTEWTMFHVRGIPIRAHVTLVLFLPLLVFLIAAQVPDLADLRMVRADAADVEAAFGGAGAIAAGVAISVGLFASVLLHELGHAVEARRHDLGVKAITLWIFGGIAQLDAMPRRPRVEALVAIAGPIVSFGLGAIGIGMRPVVTDPWLGFTVAYLGFLNLSLGAFNLLPAFPLDGGRLLRAALAARKPYVQATRIASDIGKALAVVLGLIGLFASVSLVVIALFVYMGASQEAAGVELSAALEPIPVGAVMEKEPPTVEPTLALDQLTARMLATNRTGFPVVSAGEVLGVVTLSDVRDVDGDKRPLTNVADVMSRELLVVDPRASAAEALRVMSEHNVGRLLVVGAGGSLEGVVTREGLMRAFEIARTHPVVRW